MKKSFTLILLILFSVVLLGNQKVLNASNSKWIKRDDGYSYYDKTGWKVNETRTIGVNHVDEIFEVDDPEYGIWGEVKKNGKTAKKVKVQLKLISGFYTPFYQYYTFEDELIMSFEYGGWTSLDKFIKHDEFRILEKITDIPDESFDKVSDLPQTPSDGNQYNSLGRVTFNVQNNDVIMTIIYFKTYKIKFKFDKDTDFSLFDNTEAYYLNEDGNPQVIINTTDRIILEKILLGKEDAPGFVPHVIWDLKTNELTVVNKYDAYAYVKQNKNGAVIAYFYTDTFVIDNVLKARIKYTTRNKYKFPFNISKGDYSEWETVTEDYETNDFLSYKNKTKSWQYLVPLLSSIRWVDKLFVTRTIPRIGQVDLNDTQSYYNVTETELNKVYSKLNSNFNELKLNSRYKVHAFALYENTDNMIEQIQFYNEQNSDDPKNLEIVELLYETDGKLYTTVGDDMDLEIETGPGTGDNNRPKNTILITILAIIGLVGYAFAIFSSKAYRSIQKLLSVTIVYILFIGIILTAWFVAKSMLLTVLLL